MLPAVRPRGAGSLRRMAMRLTALAVAVIMSVACGGGGGGMPSDDDPGGDADPGDGVPGDSVPGDADAGPTPDAPPPCDRDVCFAWLPRPPPPTPGEPTVFRYDECNIGGLRPGACPSGFSCGPVETFEFPLYRLEMPVCRSERTPPARVVDVDLRHADPPADGVPVVLALALNGDAWPDASGARMRAGTFTVTDRADRSRTWVFDVPARGPSMTISVPASRYDTVLQIEDAEALHYPPGYYHGELVVNRAGEATVDLPAAKASFALRVDGAPVVGLPAGMSVTIGLDTAGGGVSRSYSTAGTGLSGTFTVRPGTYDLQLSSWGKTAALPAGTVRLATGQSLVAGTTTVMPADVATVQVSGSLTLDGRDMPSGSEGGDIVFESGGGWTRVAIGTARPARFSARLFPGAHDVSYDASSARLTGVPRGVTRLRTAWMAEPSLALAATTLVVSGSVNLNGGAVDGTGGRVTFGGAGGSATMSLSAAGSYSGLLFGGSYDVSVSGEGQRLPATFVPVAAAWTATPALQTWQIAAHRLTASMTHNGQIPPADGDADRRGSLIARARILDRDVSLSTSGGTSGPIQASLLVPDGVWTVSYRQNDDDYDMPRGTFALGEVAVSADTTRSFDLASLRVTGTVTLDGAQLPVGTGTSRGELIIQSAGPGGAYTNVALPLAGTASYDVALVPDVYTLSYVCDGDCRVPGAPSWVTAYYGLGFQ
jgi:hypothetical protein